MHQYFSLITVPESGVLCPFSGCHYSSKSRYALTTHANEQHIGFEQFACPSCRAKFVSFKAAAALFTSDHPDRTLRPVTLQLSDEQQPLLSIHYPSGETSLFLRGGVVVAQPAAPNDPRSLRT